jgi:hypothetical protein
MLQEILAVCSVIAALLSLWVLLRVSQHAEQAHRDARIGRANSDELALAHSRLDMLGTALKRIEGRQVKAIARGAQIDPEAEPDAKAEPAAWRNWKNKQLTKGRIQ